MIVDCLSCQRHLPYQNKEGFTKITCRKCQINYLFNCKNMRFTVLWITHNNYYLRLDLDANIYVLSPKDQRKPSILEGKIDKIDYSQLKPFVNKLLKISNFS